MGGLGVFGESGLLWFFDRQDAEALVKVLSGCAYNGHRWVFVGLVTDLGLNLWVTAPDRCRWTHGNLQGSTASTAERQSVGQQAPSMPGTYYCGA